MQRPLPIAVLALIVAASAPAWAASIGIYADRDCGSCNLPIPAPPGFDTLFVRLSTEGLPGYANQGLGVTFRIEGMPPGWWVVETLETPPDYLVGDPLAPEGVAMYFYNRHLEGDCIPLYSIVVGPTSPGDPAVLRVTRSTHNLLCWGEPPQCLYVSYEAFEIYCACVDAGTLYINTPGDCTVAVQPASWSMVKRTYE